MGWSIDWSKKRWIKSFTQIMTPAGMMVNSAVLLTEFGGHHRDVVLGNALPVQQLVGGNRTFNRIDIKVAVHVTLPVDGIPAGKCLFNGAHFLHKA